MQKSTILTIILLTYLTFIMHATLTYMISASKAEGEILRKVIVIEEYITKSKK